MTTLAAEASVTEFKILQQQGIQQVAQLEIRFQQIQLAATLLHYKHYVLKQKKIVLIKSVKC